MKADSSEACRTIYDSINFNHSQLMLHIELEALWMNSIIVCFYTDESHLKKHFQVIKVVTFMPCV